MTLRVSATKLLACCAMLALPVAANAVKWTFVVTGYMTGYENVSHYMIPPPGGVDTDRSGNYTFTIMVDPFVGSTSFNADLLGLPACFIERRAATFSGTLYSNGTGYYASPASYYATNFCRGLPAYGQEITITSLSAQQMNAQFIGVGPDNGPPLPEPATWMLMISGFGAIGYSLRAARRTKSSTVLV